MSVPGCDTLIAAQPAAGRPPRRPGRALARVVQAWGALALVHRAKRRGFAHLQQLLDEAPRGAAPARPRVALAETRAAVARARRLYPAPVACLQRSAACVYLLRRRGVAATLVVGVRTPPFEAHAWAEVDGQVVNDRAGVARDYTVITRL